MLPLQHPRCAMTENLVGQPCRTVWCNRSRVFQRCNLVTRWTSVKWPAFTLGLDDMWRKLIFMFDNQTWLLVATLTATFFKSSEMIWKKRRNDRCKLTVQQFKIFTPAWIQMFVPPPWFAGNSLYLLTGSHWRLLCSSQTVATVVASTWPIAPINCAKASLQRTWYDTASRELVFNFPVFIDIYIQMCIYRGLLKVCIE